MKTNPRANTSSDSDAQIPTRSEVVRVSVTFAAFFLISVWCIASFFRVGISGFHIAFRGRWGQHDVGGEIVFMLLPLIAMIFLAAELLRIRRRFIHAKRNSTNDRNA